MVAPAPQAIKNPAQWPGFDKAKISLFQRWILIKLKGKPLINPIEQGLFIFVCLLIKIINLLFGVIGQWTLAKYFLGFF
jgi:hypothetical protein